MPNVATLAARGLLAHQRRHSLRSWRDFARECFCFGSEAVNASGEAVRGLVKSRVDVRASSACRRETSGSGSLLSPPIQSRYQLFLQSQDLTLGI